MKLIAASARRRNETEREKREALRQAIIAERQTRPLVLTRPHGRLVLRF